MTSRERRRHQPTRVYCINCRGLIGDAGQRAEHRLEDCHSTRSCRVEPTSGSMFSARNWRGASLANGRQMYVESLIPSRVTHPYPDRDGAWRRRARVSTGWEHPTGVRDGRRCSCRQAIRSTSSTGRGMGALAVFIPIWMVAFPQERRATYEGASSVNSPRPKKRTDPTGRKPSCTRSGRGRVRLAIPRWIKLRRGRADRFCRIWKRRTTSGVLASRNCSKKSGRPSS